MGIDPFTSDIDPTHDTELVECGVEFVPKGMGVFQPGVCIKGEGSAFLIVTLQEMPELILVDPVV